MALFRELDLNSWFSDAQQSDGWFDPEAITISSGTLSITQVAQSLTASAAVSVAASATDAQADQTLSGAASVAISATASISQTGDQTGGRFWSSTWWATGWWAAHWWALQNAPGTQVLVSASGASTGANETLSASASVTGSGSSTGSLVATQDDQTLSASATVTGAVQQPGGGIWRPSRAPAPRRHTPVSASLLATQDSQRIRARAQTGISAAASNRVSDQRINASVSTEITARASIEATGDSLIASASVDWSGFNSAEDEALLTFGLDGLLFREAA